MQIEELEARKVKIVNGIGNKEEQVKLEERFAQVIRGYKDKDEFAYEDIAQLVCKVIKCNRQVLSSKKRNLFSGIFRQIKSSTFAYIIPRIAPRVFSI